MYQVVSVYLFKLTGSQLTVVVKLALAGHCFISSDAKFFSMDVSIGTRLPFASFWNRSPNDVQCDSPIVCAPKT
jgi:hypothetical protein